VNGIVLIAPPYTASHYGSAITDSLSGFSTDGNFGSRETRNYGSANQGSLRWHLSMLSLLRLMIDTGPSNRENAVVIREKNPAR
jgi:hypothetical protein